MDKRQQEEFLKAVSQLFDRAADSIHTELMEQSARLSAQRYLIEMLYANQFQDNPEAFEEFMDGAIEIVRTHSTRVPPMDDDTATELQARVATQLQRFRESVVKRLEQALGS